eukprot:8216706-Lingulodinium_polyedra.AAC.1
MSSMMLARTGRAGGASRSGWRREASGRSAAAVQTSVTPCARPGLHEKPIGRPRWHGKRREP